MPDPTATAEPYNVRVVSPWTVQSSGSSATVPLQPFSCTSNSCITLPQAWSSGTATYNFQYWVSEGTLTVAIPPDLAQAVPDGWSQASMGQGTLNTQPAAEGQPVFGTRPFIVEETPEQAAERARMAAEEAERLRLRQEERQRERAEAEGRAEDLLQVFLSPAQQEEYARERAISVQAPSGRRYRLRRMLSGGVQELDAAGQVRATLCIHPNEDCPLADMLICQLHLLQSNEAEFRRVANRRAA